MNNVYTEDLFDVFSIGEPVTASMDEIDSFVASIATEEISTHSSICICDIDKPYFEFKGRRFLVVFYNGRAYITSVFWMRACQDGISTYLEQYYVLASRFAAGCVFEISRHERAYILDKLIQKNIISAGYGITVNQIDQFNNMEKISVNDDSLDIFGRKVVSTALSYLAQFYLNFDIDNLTTKYSEDLFSNLPTPVKVFYVSFASSWHQDIWNLLSIESLAGDCLGQWGHFYSYNHVRIVSESDISVAITRITEFAPDILGISVEINTLPMFDEFISLYSKKLSSIHPTLVLGNVVPTYYPYYFINHPDLKNREFYISQGEGELFFREIINDFIHDNRHRTTYTNTIYHGNDNSITFNDKSPIDTASLIYPPTHDYLMEGKVNILQASRGCRFQCSFCSQGPNKHWRPMPLKRLATNIENLFSKGVKELEFVDDEFFGGRTTIYQERARMIATIIKKLGDKYGFQPSYRVFSNPLIISRSGDTLRNEQMKDLLAYMKTSGLVRVYIGIESGSVEQRIRYNRKENLEDCVLALNVLRELDVDIDAGFIMFDPEMSLDDIENNINFFKDNSMIYCNTWPFSPIILSLDTPLTNRLLQQGHITSADMSINTFSYQYSFIHDDVQSIFTAIQELAKETAKVFQMLKYATKEHFGSVNQTEKTQFCWSCVRLNALIYIDAMEQMIESIRQNSSVDGAVKVARMRLWALLEEIYNKLPLFEADAYIDKLKHNLHAAMEITRSRIESCH